MNELLIAVVVEWRRYFLHGFFKTSQILKHLHSVHTCRWSLCWMSTSLDSWRSQHLSAKLQVVTSEAVKTSEVKVKSWLKLSETSKMFHNDDCKNHASNIVQPAPVSENITLQRLRMAVSSGYLPASSALQRVAPKDLHGFLEMGPP